MDRFTSLCLRRPTLALAVTSVATLVLGVVALRVGTDTGYRAFLEPAARATKASTASSAHGLDYGCGPGPVLAEMLKESGRKVDLYDPFFFSAPPLRTPYDFLTCTEAIEHFHNPRAEFGRLFELLKPQAPLIVMTAFRDVQQTSDAFLHWHYRRDVTHVSFFSQRTLHACGERFNAKVEFIGSSVAVMNRK